MRKWWAMVPLAIMVAVLTGWVVFLASEHNRCVDAGGRMVGSASSRTGLACVRPDGAVIVP